jgi:plastocyanin
LVFLAALFLAVLCQSLPAATTLVRIGESGLNFFFNPTNVTINVGDTVLWTNTVTRAHDTTHNPATGTPLWASSPFTRPNTFAFTFSQPGSYPYICDTHRFSNPEQTGSVTVVTAGLPPSIAITSPANGATFTGAGGFSFAANATDSDGAVSSVQFLINNTTVAADATSPFSLTITNLGPGTYALTAVATDNDGLSATSAPVNVVVRHRVIYGSDFFAPNALTVAVGDTVSFSNTSGSHTVTGTGAEPYCGNPIVNSCVVTFNTAGFFPYRCIPHSFPVGGGFAGMTGAVTVASSVNRRPIAVVTSPNHGAVLAAPATFGVEAAAADFGGSVASVQFFTGATSRGTDTASPYSVTVSNLAAGNYSVTARVTDNQGLINTSAPVNITVVTPVDVVLSAPQLLASGFQFKYTANAGLTYVVEGSQTAASPVPFVPLSTNVATTNLVTFTDATATNMTGRSYRVQRAP